MLWLMSKIMNEITVKKRYPLKRLTTIKIRGPAKYFFTAHKEGDIPQALAWAKQNKVKWFILGEGSNLVPSDLGFDGLVIKNEIRHFDVKDGNSIKVTVGAGENLLKFILKLNRLGLCGMEKMAGIPGTVGGAIYGCAGAYGQEIKDCLKKVKIFDGRIRSLSNKQCKFTYRGSIFKKKK